MSVFHMGGLRVVELSKQLDPATETRRCHLFRFNTGGPIPDYHTIIDITSHLGTHVECPYHHHNDWPDASSLPLTQFMGRAVYAVIDTLPGRAYITPEAVEAACGDVLREGDVLILDSPYKILPFTPATNTPADKRLRINGALAEWLLSRKVKSVGFGDGVSIESSNADVAPFHDVLMAHGITFIEVLRNLEDLQSRVFFLSFVPLPIKGLDSSPTHAYAIEGLTEFS